MGLKVKIMDTDGTDLRHLKPTLVSYVSTWQLAAPLVDAQWVNKIKTGTTDLRNMKPTLR